MHTVGICKTRRFCVKAFRLFVYFRCKKRRKKIDFSVRNYTRRSNTLLLINDDRRYSSLVLLYIDCTKKNRTKNSFGWRKIRHFCNASIALSVESSNKLWLLNVQCSKSKEFSSVGKESIEFMIFSWNVCLKIQQIDDSFNIEQINACGRSDSKLSNGFECIGNQTVLALSNTFCFQPSMLRCH